MNATSRVVATPLLNITVEESGPADGKPVMLLHGWADDARRWDPILPAPRPRRVGDLARVDDLQIIEQGLDAAYEKEKQ